jgi:hypothetical protein
MESEITLTIATEVFIAIHTVIYIDTEECLEKCYEFSVDDFSLAIRVLVGPVELEVGIE